MTDEQTGPINPLPGLMPALLDDEGRVAGDFKCISCGYNLRALHVEGRCPECGADVWDSVKLALDVPGHWIGTVNVGATALTLASWALAACIVSALALTTVQFLSIAGDGMSCATLLLGAVALIAGLPGVITFVEYDARIGRRFAARRLALGCLLPIALATLGFPVLLFGTWHGVVAPAAAQITVLLWIGLFVTMWCALLVHARDVMNFVLEPDVIVFDGLLPWAVALGGGAAVACLLLSMLDGQFCAELFLVGWLMLAGLFAATGVQFWRVRCALKAIRGSIGQCIRRDTAEQPNTTNSAVPEPDDD